MHSKSSYSAPPSAAPPSASAFSGGGSTETRVEDTPFLAGPLGQVHVLIGPVGAGKSTLALRLERERRAVRLTLDEWMGVLFRPDRPEEGVVPWYVERAARCVEQIWRVARNITATGTDVVLEIGLLRPQEREELYDKAQAAGLALTVYVVDAPRDLRRERVEARNRERGPTFSMVVPPEIFELASDSWEPPDVSESEAHDMRFVWNDGPD